MPHSEKPIIPQVGLARKTDDRHPLAPIRAGLPLAVDVFNFPRMTNHENHPWSFCFSADILIK